MEKQFIIQTSKNVPIEFIIALLKDLPDLKVREQAVESDHENINEDKLQEAYQQLFGLWEGKEISLDQIRGEQWERKYHTFTAIPLYNL